MTGTAVTALTIDCATSLPPFHDALLVGGRRGGAEMESVMLLRVDRVDGGLYLSDFLGGLL